MANEETFAEFVKEFTGDFFTHIECDKIQSEGREHWNEVVYFGNEVDLAPTGFAYLL